MKKIFTAVALLFMFCNLQAQDNLSGTLKGVNLERGLVNINNAVYSIRLRKTQLYLGKHKQNIDFLEKGIGQKVKFVLDNTIVTEIRFITSFEINE